MAYSEVYRADPEIFENKNIRTTGNTWVTEIKVDELEKEAYCYLKVCDNDGVKKYLPESVAKTHKEAQWKLLEFLNSCNQKHNVIYCIRYSEHQIPIGYIICDSPISSNGFNDWTISYWIHEEFKGIGKMTLALNEVFQHFKKMQVPQVLALVDNDNIASIKLLDKFGFQNMGTLPNDDFKTVYGVRLN